MTRPCSPSDVGSITKPLQGSQVGSRDPRTPRVLRTGMAAEQQAHILVIHHRRAFNSAACRETELELLVETRGPEQSEAFVRAMTAQGYRAQSVEPE
jgi:hypothetical protein